MAKQNGNNETSVRRREMKEYLPCRLTPQELHDCGKILAEAIERRGGRSGRGKNFNLDKIDKAIYTIREGSQRRSQEAKS